MNVHLYSKRDFTDVQRTQLKNGLEKVSKLIVPLKLLIWEPGLADTLIWAREVDFAPQTPKSVRT